MSGNKRPPFEVIDGDGSKAETLPDPDGANDEALALKIKELEQEHRDLDQAIAMMEERMPYDRLTIGRMKKRKLVLKDQIQELRDRLFPDIIA
ncbi:YdcH family protein [Parvularcula lutaonensis]|uniref:YdcH family protein n=1 Tax=Parvularcula lutaonensis TaxID=491923 RepID=A0ABV7MFP7_9PROT|nr:DUF465 domain-containing protein [Parvularcula lutaonensis]GGY50372.1 hypothetical protein GCM10007148_18960 [Parvularcula lutaonensis]